MEGSRHGFGFLAVFNHFTSGRRLKNLTRTNGCWFWLNFGSVFQYPSRVTLPYFRSTLSQISCLRVTWIFSQVIDCLLTFWSTKKTFICLSETVKRRFRNCSKTTSMFCVLNISLNSITLAIRPLWYLTMVFIMRFLRTIFTNVNNIIVDGKRVTVQRQLLFFFGFNGSRQLVFLVCE